MKTVKNLFIIMLCLMFLGACEQSPDDPNLISDLNGHPEVDARIMPFKANFYTIRSYDEGPGTCGEDPYLSYNLQIGEGNATHLGEFSTTMWFCGSGLDYKNGEGYFIAANGDELYFNVPTAGEIGHVLPLPYEDPLYEFYFKDPFTFIGGTGRFEGASGGGYTDSYVDLFDDNGDFIPEHKTDHKWVGTLILPKKNK